MAAKLIQSSDDSGATWYTYPGGTGEISREAGAINDTVFGQTFESTEGGVITVTLNANALYKGFAGYVACLFQLGTATTMTTEAMTLETGKIYGIDDATKEFWDRTGSVTPFVFFDNAVDHNADVEWIDPLFGRVKFLDAYTVTGAVTVTGTYYPRVALGRGKTFNLTQTAAAIDTSDFDTLKANGGFRTHDPGLRTVGFDITGIEDASDNFITDLESRAEIIVEINPDGADLSQARGFFRWLSHNQSGDVGQLEEMRVSGSLNVPAPEVDGITNVLAPFRWRHDATTTLHQSIQNALTAWENETKDDYQYLADGVNGHNFAGVLTDISLAGGLEVMNEFSVSVVADGILTAEP